MQQNRHWTFEVIGKPWEQNAHGPDAYNCWGIVRYGIQKEYDITMPVIPVASRLLQDVTIRKVTNEFSWVRTDEPVKHGDIILMRDKRENRRHIALALKIDGSIQILHSDGEMTASGPIGEVVLTTLEQIKQDFKDVELWRRTL